jgi:uncharacterized repeat protein (TIGR02543 family)
MRKEKVMINKNSARSVGKTLFTLFLSVAVILTFSFVSVSFADTGNTGGGTAAKIGSTAYPTVQDAIDAAEDGDTVVLQPGASADQLKITKVFDKDITFQGTGTLTMDTYGWYFNHTLTLDGKGVQFNVTSDNNAFQGQEKLQRWLILCLGGTINVKNGASMDFTFDSKDGVTKYSPDGVTCAIYSNDNQNSTFNIDNGSSFFIHGKNTKGKGGQGIQLGKTANSGIHVTNNSHFLIDGTNRGYVNSPTTDVENSDFTVQNCTANASNGGTFTAVNSTVNFLKNSGHGLSSGETTFKNSTLNSEENGYTGFDVQGELTAENSTFNVSQNGWHTWGEDLFAGMRLRNKASFDKSSALNIHDNYEVGLNVHANDTSIADGAEVNIVDNGLPDISSYQNDYYSWDLSSRAGKMAASNGGGIYNQGTLTLPKGAAVYNNHAIKAGDDIYSTGTITFGEVGSGWKLDGGENNKARNDGNAELTGKDCSDAIDGWFDDAEDGRWEAHNSEKNHIVAAAPGKYTSTIAVKAAHYVIIHGVKKWDDTSNQDGKRPDSINVSLYANSHKIATHSVSTKDADSSDSNSWKFTFAGKDSIDASQYADENGKLVFTVADDDNPTPYLQTQVGDKENDYTIINSYKPEKFCIPVWVSWDDNQNQDNVRPDSVTVHVRGTVPDKTDASKTTTVESKDLTLTRNGGWYDTDTLHNLPVYSGGQKITYSLTVEKTDSVNSGLKNYTTTVTGCAEKGFQVTNVYEPKTTDVTVTKKWSDNDSKSRPDKITVDLKGNGTVLDEATLDAKDQTDAKDKNTWTYTFKNVPVSKDGKALTYNVSEEVPDGYSAKVVKNSDASFTITNTLKPNTSGGGGGTVIVQPANDHKVTFHPNNGDADTTQTVKDGAQVSKPYDPSNSGYTFEGWYTDSTFKNAYDFRTPVKGDLDLYAKWTKGIPGPTPGTSKVKGILLPKVIANGSSEQTLTWTALTNVDGYYVYRAKCNIPKPLTIYKFKKVADVSASSPRVFKSYGLKKGVAYKYYVVGYKNVNGQKMIVQKSVTVHSVAGNLLKKKYAKYTNVKKVSVTKNAVTLKVGKTYKIQPSVKGVLSGCEILQKDHAAMFRYVYIKDGKNIKVSQNGTVKALKAGKCNVYVLGTNGVRTKVAVTVVK